MAISGQKVGSAFTITTQANRSFQAKKILLASGVRDLMPYIKGFAACWGISVVHCPYCHSYEIRGQNTALIASEERAFHMGSLVHNLTNKLTVLTNGKADFKAERIAKLEKYQINVIEFKIAELVHQNGHLKQVIFEDGHQMVFEVAYAAISFVQHSDLPASLGCGLTELGHIEVDSFQKTTQAGVFSCGDSVSMLRSVANAVSGGNLAGIVIKKELTDEQF